MSLSKNSQHLKALSSPFDSSQQKGQVRAKPLALLYFKFVIIFINFIE